MKRQLVVLILELLSTAYIVFAQSTQTITVGQFYDPLTVSALQGDVVEFLFVAGAHGVTQSTFANPCAPLSGGFDSGIVPGFSSNSTNSSPVWSLTITNASAPIWFYCGATKPNFHCANGMVGAINAPADQYTTFSESAKLVTTTPAQTPTISLIGVGASAATPPTTPPPSTLSNSATITTSPISSQTSSTSALSAETSSSSTTSSAVNKAALGGGIGGAIAGCIIVALGYLLYRAKRDRSSGDRDDRPSMLEHSNTRNDVPGLIDTTGLSASSSTPIPQSRNWNEANDLLNQTGNMQLRHHEAMSGGPEAFPRFTSYTENSMGSATQDDIVGSGHHYGPELGAQRQAQPQYQHSPSVNVHELAKEVATLLRPQLSSPSIRSGMTAPRTGSPRALPTPYQGSNPTLQVINNLGQPIPPSSPGPPQYER